MRSPLKYLLLSLIVSGCTGPETVVVSKYFVETYIVPVVLSMTEVVVPTDDPTYPYKILNIGSTTQRATLRALRSPDNRQECNALRLYFDNHGILYNHAHVVKAYAGITKNSSVQPPRSL
jgi:hypothetical protein